MTNLFGRRAVLIGAGIGGPSLAGALADYFEQVDIFERDRLAASAESRPGTAQDRHPRGLLEHFPTCRNRKGFPCEANRDSP
ncbi:hypothetical protein [Bradyrhizobium sp. AZCC 2230]|uniref:hypothetical protein n=1 Tax=Bradyrhizobium sp. AZCC 2230 TaxID=3117021 RepID=UPI002FEFEB47